MIVPPADLDYLMDFIYQNRNLQNEGKAIFQRFQSAVRECSDLNVITAKFGVWLLEEEVLNYFDARLNSEVVSAIKKCADIHRRRANGEHPSEKDIRDARTYTRALAKLHRDWPAEKAAMVASVSIDFDLDYDYYVDGNHMARAAYLANEMAPKSTPDEILVRYSNKLISLMNSDPLGSVCEELQQQ